MRRTFFALAAGVSLAALTAASADAAPVVPLIIGAIGLTGTAATIGSAVLSLAIGIGLSLAAQAFQKKPAGTTGGERQGSNVSVRESVAPRRLVYGTTRLGGTIVFMDTVQNNGRLIQVIALCEGPVGNVQSVYLNDSTPALKPLDGDNPGEINSGTFNGFGRIFTVDGDAGEDPPAFIVSNSEGRWTNDHKMNGVAAVYAYWIYDSDGTYKNGLPNISAIVRGLKVYDPRSEETGYSANAALVIRDYLLRSKENGGCGFSESDIDDTNFIAQANICDENVLQSDGSSINRYLINGVVVLDESTTPGDVLDDMLACCAGRLVWSSGKIRLFVGAWRAPVFTIAADMIVGPISVVTRQSLAGQFNAIKGKFRNRQARWEATDFKALTFSEFEDEDGGDRVYRDVDYAYCTDHASAQRLAKIELYRSRQPIEVTLTCNLEAYAVTPGDVVNLTLERYGWDTKPFEVMSWKWQVSGEDTGASLAIQLTLRETSSLVYSWNATDGQLLADEPETNLPNWTSPAAPANLVVTEEIYETTGSAGVKARAVLSWEAALDGFVNQYEPGYKLSSSSTWIALPATTGTEATLPDVVPGVYDFRVRSVNTIGARSGYSSTTKTITGLSAPPETPTGLLLAVVNGVAILKWNRTTSLDVKIGGSVVINHTPQTSSVTWANSVNVSTLPGDATSDSLPAQDGTYLVRFRDSSGILSTSFASVVSVGASPIPYTTLTSLAESPSFSGTKTNCAFDGTGLSITSTSSPATYLFSAALNLGSAKSARLKTVCEAVTYTSGDLWDSRTGTIDTWALIDGLAGGSVNAIVYYRTTQTDPTGSPTWSSWTPVTTTDVLAWGIQLKVEFAADDPTWNVRILTLSATADQPT